MQDLANADVVSAAAVAGVGRRGCAKKVVEALIDTVT
jgi:hypothetical protein